MRKSAIKQLELQARAQAMEDARDMVLHAESTGTSAMECLSTQLRISRETVKDHIREHGEYCP